MTSQEKITYLKRYRTIDALINRKIEECQKWRDVALKITPTLSDMPKAHNGTNQTEIAVEHIIEIEREINESIDELVKIRKNIEKALAAIKDDTYRRLLEYRYIDGMTWEQIAIEMHYSYQWICKLHGRALLKLKIVDRSL